VARHSRHTQPVPTLHGLFTTYDQVEPYLSEGEGEGRAWILSRLHELRENNVAIVDRTPSPYDLLDLHRVMYGTLFEWAGSTRQKECGPGGIANITWPDVRVELKKLMDDLHTWVEVALAEQPDPEAETIARIVADAHHRFQWIHPFEDTNGRTGRVFDHYLLWVTFDLGGEDFSSSPFIDYFPTAEHEELYCEGLIEADNHRPDHLRAYYTERVIAAFDALSDTEPSPAASPL
jgi:fido (protein-threonine AMPylation protein)